jgi:proline iminopeptidase
LLEQEHVHTYAARNTPGGPSRPGPLSQATASLVDDLEAVRRRLGAPRVRIVGHSHGAVIALGYAIRYPDRVERMVLIGPSLVPPGSSSESGRIVEHWERRGDRERAVQHYRRYPRVRDFAEDDRTLALWMRRTAALQFYELETLREFQRSLRDSPPPSYAALAGMPDEPEAWLREGCASVTARTLVQVGRFDSVTPPDAAAEVATRVPGARLQIIDRAGHNPWVERAAAFGRAIRGFLAP